MLNGTLRWSKLRVAEYSTISLYSEVSAENLTYVKIVAIKVSLVVSEDGTNEK